jgi:hypothetical protein
MFEEFKVFFFGMSYNVKIHVLMHGVQRFVQSKMAIFVIDFGKKKNIFSPFSNPRLPHHVPSQKSF